MFVVRTLAQIWLAYLAIDAGQLQSSQLSFRRQTGQWIVDNLKLRIKKQEADYEINI